MEDFLNWHDSWFLVQHNIWWLVLAFAIGAITGWHTTGPEVAAPETSKGTGPS
jgi:hypothetical protein